jgi:hypothetical protein
LNPQKKKKALPVSAPPAMRQSELVQKLSGFDAARDDMRQMRSNAERGLRQCRENP